MRVIWHNSDSHESQSYLHAANFVAKTLISSVFINYYNRPTPKQKYFILYFFILCPLCLKDLDHWMYGYTTINHNTRWLCYEGLLEKTFLKQQNILTEKVHQLFHIHYSSIKSAAFRVSIAVSRTSSPARFRRRQWSVQGFLTRIKTCLLFLLRHFKSSLIFRSEGFSGNWEGHSNHAGHYQEKNMTLFHLTVGKQ